MWLRGTSVTNRRCTGLSRLGLLGWNRAAGLFCCLWLFGNLVGQAAAQPRADCPMTDAQKHIQTAQAARLGGKPLSVAIESLEKAYGLCPLPDIFYYLGQIAEQEQRVLDARDYYERFLASD